MRKDKKKKLLILALGLLFFAGISGTVAWLTSVSTLENEFTVGEITSPTTDPTDPTETISISGNLYEPSWDTTADHKLVPGNTYAKDPYVGIGDGSEEAVVYVYVNNSFSNKVYFEINTGWEAVSGQTTAGYASGTYTSGLFKYSTNLVATSGDAWTSTPLFDEIITDESANTTDFTSTNNKIIVKSFIHQAKNASGTAIDSTTINNAALAAFELN